MHDRLTVDDPPAASGLVDIHGAPLEALDDDAPEDWRIFTKRIGFGVGLPINLGKFTLQLGNGREFVFSVNACDVELTRAIIADTERIATTTDLLAALDAADIWYEVAC